MKQSQGYQLQLSELSFLLPTQSPQPSLSPLNLEIFVHGSLWLFFSSVFISVSYVCAENELTEETFIEQPYKTLLNSRGNYLLDIAHVHHSESYFFAS